MADTAATEEEKKEKAPKYGELDDYDKAFSPEGKPILIKTQHAGHGGGHGGSFMQELVKWTLILFAIYFLAEYINDRPEHPKFYKGTNWITGFLKFVINKNVYPMVQQLLPWFIFALIIVFIWKKVVGGGHAKH